MWCVQEFKCLQKNYDKIGATDCHYAIANWTAMESEVSVNDLPSCEYLKYVRIV